MSTFLVHSLQFFTDFIQYLDLISFLSMSFVFLQTQQFFRQLLILFSCALHSCRLRPDLLSQPCHHNVKFLLPFPVPKKDLSGKEKIFSLMNKVATRYCSASKTVFCLLFYPCYCCHYRAIEGTTWVRKYIDSTV